MVLFIAGAAGGSPRTERHGHVVAVAADWLYADPVADESPGTTMTGVAELDEGEGVGDFVEESVAYDFERVHLDVANRKFDAAGKERGTLL
jgi:hypothetical protein